MGTRWKDYPGEFNHSLLHEELEALPHMFSPNIPPREDWPPECRGAAHYAMHEFPQGVRIETSVDEVDFDQIDTVIVRHDKNKKSKDQKVRETKEAKKQATLDKLGITQEELNSIS